jgi:hypothetical protein
MLSGIMGSMVILMATHGKSWGAGFLWELGPSLTLPCPYFPLILAHLGITLLQIALEAGDLHVG